MPEKYRATFFSTETAKQYKQRLFNSATTDEAKVDIFNNHPSYYSGIRGEVKAWVTENYSVWNEERQEWFTERVKASIPKDMIPEIEVEQKPVQVAAVKETRRNSIQMATDGFQTAARRKSSVTGIPSVHGEPDWSP